MHIADHQYSTKHRLSEDELVINHVLYSELFFPMINRHLSTIGTIGD